MKINTVLDQIDLGSMALPEFQRGYVWNRDQVRGLMQSLYRRYPVGGLLVWLTKAETATARGDGPLYPGTVELLLDGQQRITTLYGIVRGKPPRFFDGNPKMLEGLHFNLDDELFEFYAPLKMKDNPRWVNVTKVMKLGVGDFISRLHNDPEMQPNLGKYIERLSAVVGIKDIDLHVEKVTGDDKSIDVVVDIFNRVNSGGTKLSKADLALAKVCASWPEARDEMKKLLDRWARAGFRFELEWLLRCVNTSVTGNSLYTALEEVDTVTFRAGLETVEKAVDKLLNLLSSQLGLDHDAVLKSPYSLAVLTRYLARRKMQLGDHQEQNKILYWYVHTFLWGRFAGSIETVLNQDLAVFGSDDEPLPEDALDQLIDKLRQSRGDLTVRPSDLTGSTLGNRFYPLLYLLTRVTGARDWGTGVELSKHLLGKMSRLDLHHIFPRSKLKKAGYDRNLVNAVVNFTFLTHETNLAVSDRDPSEYFAEYIPRHPGSLESHWIPVDVELRDYGRYRDFLAARRELLASAANSFLDGLLGNTATEAAVAMPALETITDVSAEPVAVDDEDLALLECDEWVTSQGLPGGHFYWELAGPAGDPTAILDLSWPDGLQPGLSQPVALLLNETRDVEEEANRAGFRYFTTLEDFRQYVEREVLSIA